MHQDLDANTAESASVPSFDLHHGALGVATEAVGKTRKAVAIVLEGVGEARLDPNSGCAFWSVKDWSVFCAASSHDLRVGRPVAATDTSDRDMSELLWCLGYHTSAGRLPLGVSRVAVVKLLQWPNLSRLPHTPDMHRLCALFARRPTSLHLAGKLLDIDAAQIFRFFSAAYAAGYVSMPNRAFGMPAADSLTATELSTPHSESSLGVMLRQLWSKMSGR